jgi:hypothetical protein
MGLMVCKLPFNWRCVLAGLLIAAGIGYGALLVATYLHTTPPSALGPTLAELNRLLFTGERPISPMERRLEAADTPLGTGPLISGESAGGESMRFVFAGRSDELVEPLSSSELAQREGERLALLDWIRNGANRTAYERDDYVIANTAGISAITPELLVRDVSSKEISGRPHVRIRSLINERCVTCHNTEDGDDTARLIPFDRYEPIARYLVLDDQGNRARPWLVVSLVSLFPFAAFVCSAFACTSRPLAIRQRIIAMTIAVLAILFVSWLAGSLLAPVLFAAAVIALICIELQLLASVAELLGK